MRGHSLTPDQIDELIRSYIAKGTKGTADLAKRCGVDRKYPSTLARIHARKYNYQPKNFQWQATRDHNDKRWAWAVERGSIAV